MDMNELSTRMMVLIGADVDPRLPGIRDRISWDPWDPLDLISNLETGLGQDLPRISWLIRADDTIRHVTGSFVSGYTSRSDLWDRLQSRDHELGWHFHHWTFLRDSNGFDPDPAWLPEAHDAVSRCFPVLATRTGWDYANDVTIRRLDSLGVRVDFSALPGHVIPWTVEGQRFVVDWRRCPRVPYHPSAADYQRSGEASLRLLEVPIASFRAGAAAVARRVLWRTVHRQWSFTGVAATTRLMTASWADLPAPADVLAFYFHPEELTSAGIANFAGNVARLRAQFDPEFVTARELAARLAPVTG
jgi:hypothetical protein